MESQIIRVRTGGRETVRDITSECAEFAKSASGGGDGILHVFVPHATAGVALLELGAGSDTDLLAALADLLPADDRWRHAHGSHGHGRSHVLPAFIAPSAHGSRSRWWTSTWTTRTGRSGCRFWAEKTPLPGTSLPL